MSNKQKCQTQGTHDTELEMFCENYDNSDVQNGQLWICKISYLAMHHRTI